MRIILFTWLEWDSKFGISDIIGTIAAVLTLVAVFISNLATRSAKKSAEIAKESSEYTKKQTFLMEEDLKNTHLPKLIPVPLNFVLPKQKIHSSAFLDDISKKEIYEINITNVFQGNAYMVSSWLEIDINTLKTYDRFSSTEAYNSLHNEKYEFRIHMNPKVDKSIFNILLKDCEGVITEVLESSIFQVNYPKISILTQNSTFPIFIPNHIEKIILDDLYRLNENPRQKNRAINQMIKLCIKYKSGPQLETDDYTLRIYKFSISNLSQPLIISNENINDIDDDFVFSIDFHFMDEIINSR